MEDKICKDCKQEKQIIEFSKIHKGKYYQSYCKQCAATRWENWDNENIEKKRECRKEWEKRNREKRREYQREYQNQRLKLDPIFKKKKFAASGVNIALKQNKIKKRNICEICYSTKNVQGHHEDYDKPLEVVWLCIKCHRLLHKQYCEQNIIFNLSQKHL